MRLARLVLPGLLVLHAACGGGDPAGPPAPPPPPPPPPPPAPVASVSLSASQATLVPTQTITLVPTLRDAATNVLTGRAITWTSTVATVASVSQQGLVTALTPGSTTVTATSEGQSASAAITVLDGAVATPAGGQVNAAGGSVVVTLPAGALTQPTTITVAPVATVPADPKVLAGTWYDFGPSGTQFAQPVTIAIKYTAAQVPAGVPEAELALARLVNGVWTDVAGSSVNVATRTVTGATTHFSGYAISRRLPAVASVEVGPALTLVVGSSGQLSAALRDASNNLLTGREVAWNSLAPAVATVSQTGQVQAIAPGSAAITATSEGIVGQVTVTVIPVGQFALVSLSMGAGGAHACGLSAAGEAWCWGRNTLGALGDGSTVNRNRPVRVSGAATFTRISAGSLHTCALTANGRAWCWGDGGNGRLGNGSTTVRTTPVEVQGGPTFVDIQAGFRHTCALTAQGRAWCWGDNTFGQSGGGTPSDAYMTPVQVAGDQTFTELRLGYYHTCGVSLAGPAYCWGDNGEADLTVLTTPGILGVGTLALEVPTPLPVVNAPQVANVAAGLGFACLRTPGGAVSCWGVNAYGNLGDGTQTTRLSPTLVAGGAVYSSITAGGFHTCARTPANAVWCWGRNILGQLGNGLTANSALPVQVTAPGMTFSQVVAGASTTCALRPNGEVWCWGYGEHGTIGNGSNANRLVPTKAEP